MDKHIRRLSDLITIAEDHSEFTRHKHAAALYIGNTLVSIGVNRLKTHPLQARFGTNGDSIFLHAEIDAIKNALKRVEVVDLQKAILYIAKSKKGKAHLSKPCLGCQRAIVHFGITNIYWTE